MKFPIEWAICELSTKFWKKILKFQWGRIFENQAVYKIPTDFQSENGFWTPKI